VTSVIDGNGRKGGRDAGAVRLNTESRAGAKGKRGDAPTGRRPTLASRDTERRAGEPSTSACVVACIEVEPVDRSHTEDLRSAALWNLAVRRMERCIRPGDSMCMLGGSRLAVCFGNGGYRVAPSILGGRLARAMGDHLAVGTTGLDLRVRVGMGVGSDSNGIAQLTTAAMAASFARLGGGGTALAREVGGGSELDSNARPIVIIAHVPEKVLPLACSHQARTGEPANGAGLAHRRRLVRRVLVPFPGLAETPAPDPSPLATAAPGKVGGGASRSAPGLRVLVIDADGSDNPSPRIAVEVVASMARKTGAHVTFSPPAETEKILVDKHMVDAQVAIVVLEHDTRRQTVDSSDCRPWERPARLVRSLSEAGAMVIALGVGASAAAVAACVEQGAIGLLNAKSLPHELATIAANGTSKQTCQGTSASVDNGHTAVDPGSRRLPGPYNALIGLTPSERRVLFHLMEGLSAAEIAETLVVSIPTVRSHIRSILRKLNVNSQLAAVAIANGTLHVGRATA
jgi:DNA-binding CsgD family transcriptional regulator